MRRPKFVSSLVIFAAMLVALPLRSDGGAPCDIATGSLTSTLNNPVSGDEKFFTLPVGPSNVMFLLDTSGSMLQVPQCGDASTWGDGSALATCKWPTFATMSPAPGTIVADGTCNVAANPNLAWMLNYTPTAALVDPGHGISSAGLVDKPTWGTGCTGDNCLFQSGKVYTYPGWGETSATPTTTACSPVTVNYNDVTCSGLNLVTTAKTLTVTPPNCAACLTDAGAKGFWFSSVVYGYHNATQTKKSNGTVTACNQTNETAPATNTVYMSGGWLNANPPKFMSARKVIKNVAWIDPATSSPTDQLRMGLSYVSSGITDNAAIVVPLGPKAADAYPVNPTAYVIARQAIFDALNHQHETGSLPTPGVANGYASSASPTWGGPVTTAPPSLASGGTPMATGLFHVAQYFTQIGTYSSVFNNASFELAAFKQNVKGRMNVAWVDTNTSAICWSCQKSAVIIVTDGSPNTEMAFPANIAPDNIYQLAVNCGPGSTKACNVASPSKCCSPSENTSKAPSYLPSVAQYWANHDLAPSSFNTDQYLTVSTVSFNLPANNAQTILQATANMGNGKYNNAADGTALAMAVSTAVNAVAGNATSFGAPAATALTTINAVDTKAFLTRFKPNQKATWEGHLFQWMLFDESAAGCDPSKKYDPNDPAQRIQCGAAGNEVSVNFDGTTTPEGYNVCTKSFLVDKDCAEVKELPGTGEWVKKGTNNLPATAFWDAGEVLSNPAKTGYRTAAEHEDNGNIAPASKYAASGAVPRNLWTVLPDGSGKMLELETKNAAALAPYMNLDSAFCASFESLAKLCGTAPLPSCPITVSGDFKTTCAQQVILFARGWDVMDQDADGCAGPGYGISSGPTATGTTTGNPSNGTSATSNTTIDGATRTCVISGTKYTGEERDRNNDAQALTDLTKTQSPSFYKLGDIFHSAPVLVHPPTSEAMCKLGLDNQCVRTIFGYTPNSKYLSKYQTDLDTTYAPPSCKSGSGNVDAYRAWRSSLGDRENVVLVGANDGFLHAFDAGGPDKTTGKQDIDCVWPNVKDGNGEELWGVLPPDLLPRLRDALQNHQYLVDGNVMVRDVWVDNAPGDASSNNPVSASGNLLDGVKQKNEFRTVAVFSERAGGTQYTGIDVTGAFSTDPTVRPRPTFLWSFPPPRSDDAQYMGQSWSDSAPRPPPIGPVRLEKQATDPDPQGKKWVEKWAVMLNGGYDPTLTRGRAVWMVDAWTGSVFWRYTDVDFKKEVLGDDKNTATSMFPVPAGVALVDIGDPATGLDSDNFFDTATWGDVGGNLFVARFDTPGVRGSNGRVGNWRAARTFEQGRTSDDSQSATNRSEFFYMTSNTYEPQRSQLRVLIGSGNREQILEQGQGCGPDNLMSCCQAGCSVTSTSTLDYGTCSSKGTFTCTSAGVMSSTPVFAQGCGSGGAAACTGGALNQFNGKSTYSLSCGSSGTSTASGTTTCDATGLCTVTPVGTGHDLTPPGAGTCDNKAKFYGIWAYGGYNHPEKAFSTDPTKDYDSAGVRTFDLNRFTDVKSFTKSKACTSLPGGTCSLVDTTYAVLSTKGILTCSNDASKTAKCSATVDDPGWFYSYNVTCPLAGACQSGCNNEKTASGSAVINNCTTWNSFLPKGSAASGSDPCQGAQTAQQSAIAYSSNYVSGAPTLACNQGSDDNAKLVYRGAQRSIIAPPAGPQGRASLNGAGKVYYSTLQLDPGAGASSSGAGARSVASPLYWTEVPRDAHRCRHEDNKDCQ